MLPSFVKLCSKYRTQTLFGRKIARSRHSLPTAGSTPPCKHCKSGHVRRYASPAISDQTDLSSSKKKLVIQWQGGEVSSSYHSQWLVRHCRCHQCLQKSSGQRVKSGDSFHDEYNIDEVRIGGEERIVQIKMLEDPEHVLQLPISFLYENSYDPAPPRDHSSINQEPPPLVEPIPAINYCDLIAGGDEEVHHWLSLLAEKGLVLLKGAPIKAGTVTTAAEFIAHVQETLYGVAFDVVSKEDAINIAYTNNGLDPHMDLVYYQSPPGLQFLHCLQFDNCVAGGESIFVDGFQVARMLRETHPEDFHFLTAVPATFQKVHYRRERPAHFVYRKPHISVNQKGEVSGIMWAPPFEGPLCAAPDLVEPYYRAYKRFALMINHSNQMVKFRLQPGDIVTFNNLRILHGRCGFTLNGGMRHLQGLYVNIDEFRSKLHYLSVKLHKPLIKYHIGNGDA